MLQDRIPLKWDLNACSEYELIILIFGEMKKWIEFSWESANFRYILKVIVVTWMSPVCAANFCPFFTLKKKNWIKKKNKK